MADDHELSAKLGERQIPVFTVFKNDCILKNIYLLDNPPSSSSPPSTAEHDGQETENLETLWVGRHPDCNIRLEHPSISRFHLKIHSNPSSRSLSVTDLNSVHGTWISGKKVDPFVMTELNEGDALQLGGSSRLYMLHWVPYSRAYDMEDPFVPPQLSALEVEEETEDPTMFQNESSLLSQNTQVHQISSDSLEGLDLLFSDENLFSSVQQSSLSTPHVSKDLYYSLFDEEALPNMSSPCGIYGLENEISSNQFEEESITPQAFSPSSVHQTVSQDEDMEGLDLLFSDENLFSSVQESSLSTPHVSRDLYYSMFDEEALPNMSSPCGMYGLENEISSNQFEEESITPQAFSPSSVHQTVSQDEDMEGLDLLFSDENLFSSVQESSLSTPHVSKNLYNSLFNEEALPNKSSPCGIHGLEIEISSNQFEEESRTPRAFSPSSVHQTVSQDENMEASVNRSNVSIWSRRGKPNSVLIKTSQSRGKSVRTGSEANAVVHETYVTEPLENHFASPKDEVIFTPDKENHSNSTRSLMKKSGKTLPSEAILNTTISRLDLDDNDDDEVFTPDKENITPNSRLLRSIKYVEEENHQKSYRSSPLKTAVNCSMYQDSDDDYEVFTPDKENITPNSRLLRSMKYLEEGKNQKSYRSSPLKTAVNCNTYQEDAGLQSSSLLKESHKRNIMQERRSTNSSSKSHATLKKKIAVKVSRADRDPFQPLSINIASTMAISQPSSACQITSKSSRSLNCFESEEVIPQEILTLKSEIRRWSIVADTGCLLNKKSRRELQLLRGLKGTSLFIPRIVVRELDCLLKRGSLFRRTTDVSEALEWIEDCMAKTQWWIHVQSSAELGMLIPPTPPASSYWCSEDTNPFNSVSVPFSPYSLQEIVTPTAEDHILECALSIKRSRNDEQLVLLSNDVAMMIKAMAEGVNCETPEDFRKSLVNPFSERFLFNGSSPRGPTWSFVDDTVLKEKYYPSPTKKLSKPGGVKGLKLILQHNSKFKQVAF